MSKFKAAFEEDLSLAQRVEAAATSEPRLLKIFEEISDHILSLKSNIKDLHSHWENTSFSAVEPHPKKRKLSHDGLDPTVHRHNGTKDSRGPINGEAICVARDISFSVPVRKKMGLEIVKSVGKSDGGIRALNAGSGSVDFGLSLGDLEQVIAVPMPEKAQPTYSFIAVPRPAAGAPSATPDSPDCLVWTVPATGTPQNIELLNNESVDNDDTCLSVILRTLNRELKILGKKVEVPNAEEFISSIVQAHRKEEKGFHVKAWRGSKDGFLYFLEPGMLFGFRKPILYFPFSTISSVSYTSVLARTFNLVLSGFPSTSQLHSSPPEPVDFEFSMLDQADFAGIDAYIKRHGLHDASLAARRRAEQFNVNRPKSQQQPSSSNPNGKGVTQDDQGDAEEDVGDLARAERALQDAEDEEEEDFEPGSGGESDGSGSDSEEEEGNEINGDEDLEEGSDRTDEP